MRKYFLAFAASATMLLSGAASAATIGFEDGFSKGGKYFEDGYVFEQITSGAVSTPRGCVYEGVNSECLLLPNASSSKIVKMSREDGGSFDLLSFLYDGRDGSGPALYVSTSTTGGTLFSEFDVSNTMTSSGPLTQFMDVTMIFFRDAGTGSSRVDDIVVSEVPLPAAGLLLLGGLGALRLLRRRKTA